MGAEAFIAAQIVDFAEGVDDRVAALLQAGTGITLTYNDGAGTLTIANTGLGGSTGSTDNRILRADGTGGATVQNSAVTIDDSGNISGLGTVGCGDRITLSSDTYIERPSSGLINIFQAGAVRAAISSGEITATSAIRLTAFNPAAPDIAFIRNSTGPTAETRAAGGLRVRTADGSAAGAIDCGAITASGATRINVANSGFTPALWVTGTNGTLGGAMYFEWPSGVSGRRVKMLAVDSVGLSVQNMNDAGNGFVGGMAFCVSHAGNTLVGKNSDSGERLQVDGSVVATGIVTCQSGFVLASRTKAAVLASSTAVNSGRFQLSDAGLIGREVYPDGTNWRYASDDSIVT